MMITHEFTFVVDHRLSDDEIDVLFDRLDDVTPEREHARTLLGFDRAGESLAAALVSALRDVEAAGLVVGSVRSEDLVTLKEIAARAGRTYESVRLLAAGKRALEDFRVRCRQTVGPSTAGLRSEGGWLATTPRQSRTASYCPSNMTDSSPPPITWCAPER